MSPFGERLVIGHREVKRFLWKSYLAQSTRATLLNDVFLIHAVKGRVHGNLRNAMPCRSAFERVIPHWRGLGEFVLRPEHLCSSNCFCRLSCASFVRLIEVMGTLNSRLQAAHIATTGVVLSHLVTLRIRFAIGTASVFKSGEKRQSGDSSTLTTKVRRCQ